MTEEQNDCKYCHFDEHGADFGETDGVFRLAKMTDGYYIESWLYDCTDVNFLSETNLINYCPMCGRKLTKG